MVLSDAAHTSPFQCLAEDQQPPNSQAVRELAKIVIEQYARQSQGIKKWRKAKPFTVDWTRTDTKPPQPKKSSPIHFDMLVEHFENHRRLDHEQLGLPPLEHVGYNWMDADVTAWGFYVPASNGGEPNTLTFKLPLSLGPQFPVAPAIDREGFATTSPQLHLQRGLLRARERLIQQAPLFVPQSFDRNKGEQAQFRMGGEPPLPALMDFFNLCVSLVDITLIQAYYAGYYAADKTGLTFNRATMGPIAGRRISDKIKWIRALSGNDINAPREMTAFNELKAVRNHLAHFDPPCLSVTIDDVAGWLSKVSDLAWLLIKIRGCLRVPLSGLLIQLALSPSVTIVPRDPMQPRHPQRADVGYSSSTWQGLRPHCEGGTLQVPLSMNEEITDLHQRIHEVTKRDLTINEVVRALLRRQLSHLKDMSDEKLKKHVESILSGAPD